MSAPAVSVLGQAAWTPALGGAPAATLLPARLKRRTSLLTRMAVEVGQQALAGVDVREPAIVLASAFGEIQTTGELLDELAAGAEGGLSPTRFHNSVHNTAAGYLSIVTANRGVHTAIAAGRETAAMAVLEAACMVAAGLGPVLTIIVEEALPDVLAADGGRYEPLAVGLLLATQHAGRPRLALRRGVVDVTLDPAQSPCAPALALHEAIVRATSEPRVVPLGPVAEGGQTWYAEVEAGDEHAAAT